MTRRALPRQLAAELLRLASCAARVRAWEATDTARRLEREWQTAVALDLTADALCVDELPDLTRFAEMIG